MEQQTVFIPEIDEQEVETDLVIIGGGPAGLSAGICGAQRAQIGCGGKRYSWRPGGNYTYR